MHCMRTALGLLFVAAALGSAHAQTSVGVSIGINQPGAYGRINIGNMGPPPVVLAQPVIIQPRPVVAYQEPVYLYVPPGHQKNWSKHCGRYRACGQPVYFVQETWVRERYEEHQDQEHPGARGAKEKKHKDKGKHGKD